MLDMINFVKVQITLLKIFFGVFIEIINYFYLRTRHIETTSYTMHSLLSVVILLKFSLLVFRIFSVTY